MERCEWDIGDSGEVPSLQQTGEFAVSLLHGCGEWTPADGAFCAFCGAALTGDQRQPATDPSGAPGAECQKPTDDSMTFEESTDQGA
jgi:hypothetical protein